MNDLQPLALVQKLSKPRGRGRRDPEVPEETSAWDTSPGDVWEKSSREMKNGLKSGWSRGSAWKEHGELQNPHHLEETGFEC